MCSVRHSRVQASRPRLACSTADFCVIDLIAHQYPKPDAEFTPHGDARLADALLLQLSAIEPAKRRLVTRALQASLAPQESYETIALLREFSQALPRAARVFTRNHPDV